MTSSRTVVRKALHVMACAILAGALPHPQATFARPESKAQYQRVLALEGGQNFRDLGGYRTRDGRRVKWGLLYRSGAMDTLTATDFATLSRLGIVMVCDLRSAPERARQPVPWPKTFMPRIFAQDYVNDPGPLGAVLRNPKSTGAQAQTAFAGLYAELPYRFAAQYRVMFRELVNGHAPLAFNCSGGKDRTGVAAALLLSALGVPRETVMQDFLLSNRTLDMKRLMAGDSSAAAMGMRFRPEVVRAIMGVDRRYLDAAFDAIERRSGALDTYYRKELGLSDSDLARLKAIYLE